MKDAMERETKEGEGEEAERNTEQDKHRKAILQVTRETTSASDCGVQDHCLNLWVQRL